MEVEMRLSNPVWRVVFAIVLSMSMTIFASAQGAPQMSAERSRAVAAQIPQIEANKAAFVNQLLTQWALVLDPLVYDPVSELSEAAMKAPAYQLYGASLVGDYSTFLSVLSGRVGASTFVQTLAASQIKQAPAASFDTPQPTSLGSNTDSLVYTPIAPCRMVDTRGTGARTGLIVPGAPRSFDLTTSGYVKGQGGAVAGCTGLPTVSPAAWAANITVTGYGAIGGLKAYGFSQPEPNASIINYQGGIFAVANGQTLPGCYACADDVTIAAFSASTHVIIDVVGYYFAAGTGNSSVSRFAGTATNINNSSFAFVYGGICPAGTSLIGGEVDHGSGDLAVGEYHQNGSTQWVFWMINNSGGTGSVTAYTRCIDTPVRVF
jgi:hypothetical protein